MQVIVDIFGDIIGVIGLLSIIFVPFAANWIKSIVIVFLIFFFWGFIRFSASIAFKDEPGAPGIGYLVAPILYSIIAVIVKGMSVLLFKIPILARLKDKILQKRSHPETS